MKCVVVALLWLFTFANRSSLAEDNRFAGLLDVAGDICGSSQVGIFGDTTTVLAHGAIYYKTGSGPWLKSPVPLPGHSIARMPDGRWIMNYSDFNGQVVQVDDLSGKGQKVVRSELAGLSLYRPHDQVVDPTTGYVYLIDGKMRLFRFKDLDGPVEVWTFTAEQMGYARSLSWFDGHVHVNDSSRGEVIRIDNYEKHLFTTFRSPRPHRINPHPFMVYGEYDFMGGSLSATGLILNDVEKVGDLYYGTNEFSEYFAMGGDPRPARFIRWRTWADFEKGKWEDLSAHLPASDRPFTPYYITVDKGILYVPTFNLRADGECIESRIMQFDPASLTE
jgi:hypothetical protein